MSARDTKTIVIAVVVVVITFVSGAAAGFFGAHFLPHRAGIGRGHMMPQLMVRHLARRLDLTAEQKTKIEAIVMRHHQRIEKLNESVRPQLRQEIEAANREIEAVLTPEQREKFAKMRMRLGHREGRARTGSTR